MFSFPSINYKLGMFPHIACRIDAPHKTNYYENIKKNEKQLLLQ